MIINNDLQLEYKSKNSTEHGYRKQNQKIIKD